MAQRAFSPSLQGLGNPLGIGLFYPNQGSEAWSAKPGALILTAWNSEKLIAKINCLF
jgi:hypothetical protein